MLTKRAICCLFNVKAAKNKCKTAVLMPVKRSYNCHLKSKRTWEKERTTVIKYLKKGVLRFWNSKTKTKNKRTSITWIISAFRLHNKSFLQLSISIRKPSCWGLYFFYYIWKTTAPKSVLCHEKPAAHTWPTQTNHRHSKLCFWHGIGCAFKNSYVSGWAVSGNFTNIIDQVNRAKKHSIVSLDDKKLRKKGNKNELYEPHFLPRIFE